VDPMFESIAASAPRPCLFTLGTIYPWALSERSNCGFRRLRPGDSGIPGPLIVMRQSLFEVEVTGPGGGPVEGDDTAAFEDAVEYRHREVVVVKHAAPFRLPPRQSREGLPTTLESQPRRSTRAGEGHEGIRVFLLSVAETPRQAHALGCDSTSRSALVPPVGLWAPLGVRQFPCDISLHAGGIGAQPREPGRPQVLGIVRKRHSLDGVGELATASGGEPEVQSFLEIPHECFLSEPAGLRRDCPRDRVNSMRRSASFSAARHSARALLSRGSDTARTAYRRFATKRCILGLVAARV
jgi:hypothetical protein